MAPSISGAFSALSDTSYGRMQTVMDTSIFIEVLAKSKNRLFSNSLIFPFYFAAASLVIFLVQMVLSTSKIQSFLGRTAKHDTSPIVAESTDHAAQSNGLIADLKRHVLLSGGVTVFTYRVIRLLSTLALLGFAIATLVIDEMEDSNGFMDALGKWGKNHKGKKSHQDWLTKREWIAAALCMAYLYTALLAVISVVAKKQWSRAAIYHLNFVLVPTMIVYAYRDIVPLATFTKIPQDIEDGWLLWAKIIALAVAGVAVPLFIPREYTPVDPSNPAVPTAEQTAPVISLVLYVWMDPVVKAAFKVAHLPYEQLPHLADYDKSSFLKSRAFKHLDAFAGASERHLFFGLLRVFARDYIVLISVLIVQVCADFASPIGINRLLHYLEVKDSGTEKVEYRPWLWITWLFLGPTISSLSFDWYIFIATRVLVRCEAIITQMVLEHALRIRMKAETHSTRSSIPTEASTPGDTTPLNVEHSADSSSHTDGTLNSGSEDNHSRETTLEGSSPSVKSTDDSKKKEEDSAPVDPEAKNLIGKINNLVTSDLNNITSSRDFIRVVVYTPVSVALCIVFLYAILGWSAFVGLAVIILSFPLPGFLTKVVQDVQASTLKKTDGRVQVVTEVINVMRMVKLFGWERKMDERIAEKREEELVWIKRRQLLELGVGLINFLIPILTMLATYGTYASKVFSSMTIFNMFSEQLHRLLFTVTTVTSGKVSLDRLTTFLRKTELLDNFSDKHQTPIVPVDGPRKDLGFDRATFAWSNDYDGFATPSKREFMLRIDEELVFHQNCINLVIGPTGSGKTSLLMALLGEMHFIPSGPGSWFNLPREGGVAYAAQESWVLNATIKENILFGSDYDEERYKKVINQCCLKRDLTLFDAGDATEVGEKGLTLSGGQKARVTLARAIYSKASIILLDDVLAALDVHTSKWIVEKCLKGDLIKDRTIILVTHNIAMTQPIADFVVSLKDGRIASQGSMSVALAKNKALVEEAKQDAEALDRDADDLNADDADEDEAVEKKSDGKLIVAEEIQEGHLSWASLRLYLVALGGNHVMLFFLVYFTTYVIHELGNTIQTWFLGYWASQYDIVENPAEVPALKYIGIYGAILGVGFLCYVVAFVVYVFGAIRASRTINRQLTESLLGTTLRWLDTTPTSRIIARCTQDMRAVDGMIPDLLMYLSQMTLSMFFKFCAVIYFTPVFVFPGIAVALLGYWIGQVYIKAQLSVKREMSNARSPILAHFGAAIAGLTSIRAYGAQNAFITESLQRIDKYTRTARTFYNLNRWIDIRIDSLGSLFSASLAAYLVYGSNQNASNIGFSLNMAVGFSSTILWFVRLLNMFEVEGNSLERINQYLNIEQEEKRTKDGVPPAYWPASGKLRVEGLSARYSPEGPKVLHDLSFTINSGERIGIVGRTGSGKSSLTLSLLRCIYTEGTVYLDDLPTKNINLDDLRSKITIIPQVPELLSGSLRQNLDPFDQYDDATLNDALRAAGLFSLQSEMEEGRITLDSSISSGGSNLSVGQRQILALARALVRGSKMLILDEATSAIDYKTDSIIQTSLRNELNSDMTLITVAHRLQTIMDADKIMVLDAGHIVEFDSPMALLALPDGKLRSLVDESADKDMLYQMAAKKA